MAGDGEGGTEDRVVYDDGEGHPRSLRGRIVKEDAAFLTLERRDGTYELAKSSIRKIVRARRADPELRGYTGGGGP